MTTIKPAHPQKFAYYHPIIVCYADLDPQQHVKIRGLSYVPGISKNGLLQ